MYRMIGDWRTAVRIGNYWRDHYNIPHAHEVPDDEPNPDAGTSAFPGQAPDPSAALSSLDTPTRLMAHVIQVLRELPPTLLPQQMRMHMNHLIDSTELHTRVHLPELEMLAMHMDILAGFVRECGGPPLGDVHLTDADHSDL
eukprot:s747_g22.t1